MAEALHDPQNEQQNEQTNEPDHIWPMSLIVNTAYAASFACIKCKGIPKLCMTDDDGEILCDKCAENIDNTIINKAVQRMVNRLKMKCLTLSQDPNYEQKLENNDEESEGVHVIPTQLPNQLQCDWIGKIQDYDAHSKECQFVIVNCEECKTFKCQRKLLDKHMIECPQVKINCPLSCGVCILRKNKETHLENDCMEQLLDCINDDCKEQLKRKDFKNHIENVCDVRIVECEYKTFGCKVEHIKANQLRKHMDDYKFEHLSNKFDFITNQLSAKISEQNSIISRQQQKMDDVKSQFNAKIEEQNAIITTQKQTIDNTKSQITQQNVAIERQQQTIDDIKSQLEEKGDGIIPNVNTNSRALLSLLSISGIVHDCDARILLNSGWKCVYDKSYSHKTSTNELRALCGQNMDIFVGGYHKDNKNNIILGAFGPSSVLHQFIGSKTEAIIPSDINYKSVYKVYWYHIERESFGFASVSKVDCRYAADTENTNGGDRLSWYVDGSNGWRLGSKQGLNSNNEYYYKIMYVKQK